MNPYSEKNKKVPDRESDFYLNRREFILEYMEDKDDIKIMIIGEAPGLDGCGYSGIGFTAEYNAINHLQLDNYHNTTGNFQKEDSADYIYKVLERIASCRSTTVKKISKKIYFTNCCLCVPLSDSIGTSITEPDDFMKQNCRLYLKKQIELINPVVIICLGNNALKAINGIYNFMRKDVKITDCIRNNVLFNINAIELIPELHPSPRNKNGRFTKDLYPGIADRLYTYICRYL